MALRGYKTLTSFRPGIVAFVWEDLQNGDTGDGVLIAGHADVTGQITGTFGSGGACTLEGRMEGGDFSDNDYTALTDAITGVAISLTTRTPVLVVQHTAWLRPRILSGDGSTSLTCVVMAVRGN